MKLIKQLLMAFVLLCATQAFADPEAGKDYQILNPAQPTHSGNKIEVLEFFYYGCAFCFKLHPLMSTFEKNLPGDVTLTFVPVIFHPNWESMARTFYALEDLNQRKQLDDDLYNSWNVDNLPILDETSATDFVVSHGVDRRKFSEAYNSAATQERVTLAEKMGQAYNLHGTPTLVVDGKFLITGLPPADTMLALYSLIDEARKERAGKH